MPGVELNVKLLSHTLEPELTVAMGGRLCYSATGIDALKDAVAENAAGFVDRLKGYGHLSPIEHASFTFGVEGVSRALMAQITRHRIASFSVQSQRYVTQAEDFTYIVPPSVQALGEEAEMEYRAQMQTLGGFYAKWVERGIKAEDARFVLPNAAETRMIVTMNARELMHFFVLRCCNRAQWEIRRLAWSMLGIARREAPALFCGVGTACVSGGCSEGKMSCGQAGSIQEMDAQLTELAGQGASDAQIIAWVCENISG